MVCGSYMYVFLRLHLNWIKRFSLVCWIPCYLHGSPLWCSSFWLIFVMILNRLQLFPAMWWQIMIWLKFCTCIPLTCAHREDDSTQCFLLMQCGAITIHQPVRTGLMEILMMTPEGKSPYSQTGSLVREPQTFSLISHTQMKAVYFFLCVYIVIL